jgi:hypothetical protein
MSKVVDPAGWDAAELEEVDNWSYKFDERDIQELSAAVARVRSTGVPLADITPNNFPLTRLGATLFDVRRELIDGRGIVMLRGFPIDSFDRFEQVAGLLGIGSYLGRRVAQNAEGHILGHVKNLGGDYADPNVRAYVTNAELYFHTDAADYVGLLCLAKSKSGGESRIASSVSVYNKLLQARPDVVESLLGDWFFTKSGEVDPGELPYFSQPIMGFERGYFSAGGIGALGIKSQNVSGVPRWTEHQKEAVRVYHEVVEQCAVDIAFEPGDIQLLNNHVMLHSRRAFEDWPEAHRKRHLLRLWLHDEAARPIPIARRESPAGRGLNLRGMTLTAPLDVESIK